MRRLQLKPISFEKQMTVVLPCCIAILFLFGIAIVERQKAQPDVTINTGGERQSLAQQEASLQPFSVLCVLHEGERSFCSLLSVHLPDAVTAESLPETEAVYRTDGALAAKTAIGATYYVDMTFEGLRRLLQYCGDGMVVELEETVYYADDTGFSVSFPKGEQQLSANQSVYLLRALEGEDGELVADMCADLMVRYGLQTEKARDRYAVLTECADTDFRIYDFVKYIPWLIGDTTR